MTLTESLSARVHTSVVSAIISTSETFRQFMCYSETTISHAISGTVGLIKNGLAKLILSGSNSFTGNISVNAGTLELTNSLGGTYAGNISIGGTFLFGTATAHTFSGALSGIGKLEKKGAAQLTLTNSNNFTGLTEVSVGILRLQNAAANNTTLGGDINVTGAGRLSWGASTQVADTTTIAVIDGTGGATTSNLDVGIHNETIKSITMNSGWIRKAAGSLVVTDSFSLSGGTVDFPAPGSRIITTTATTTLGAVNFRYSTAAINGNGTQGFEIGNLTVSDSTNLTFTNVDAVFGRINLGTSTRTITVGTGATMTVGWIIANTGGIIKDGTGTLALGSVANTYTGSTTISAGTITASKTTSGITGYATYTPTSLTVDFANVTPNTGNTYRFFPGSTATEGLTITLTNAGGKTASYDYPTSTLTIN